MYLKILSTIYFLLCLYTVSRAQSLKSFTYNDKGWKSATAYLSEYMDQAGPPCTNISRFMCGKFGNKADGTFQAYRDEKTQKLIEDFSKAVLKINLNANTTPMYSRTVKKFYDQCMNAADDKSSMKDIYSILYNTFGKFPVFMTEAETNSTKWDVWYAMGKLQQNFNTKLAVEAMFSYQHLVLKPFTPIKDFPMDDFRQQIVKAAKIVNKTINLVNFIHLCQETQALFDDWKEAGNVSKSKGGSIQVNVEDLALAIPTINWSSYFRGLLPEYVLKNKTWSNTTISVEDYRFMIEVGKVFSRHPSRAVILLMYGDAFLMLMGEYLHYFQQVQDHSSDLLYNLQATKSNLCVTYLMDNMPAAAVRVYFDYLGEDIFAWRNEIKLIGSNIFCAMKLLIASVQNVSATSIERMHRKLDTIKFLPGIPRWISDDQRVVQNKIKYNASSSLVANNMAAAHNRFLAKVQIFMENKVTSTSSESTSSSSKEGDDDPEPTFEMNSFYKPWEPSVNIYLGYILPPVFSLKYPLAVKYGRVGALIGHETMHAFDSNNIKQPAKGDTRLVEDDEMGIYDRQEKCIIDQYSQYCYKQLGECIPGANSVAENLADIGGLRAAFAAFQMAKGVYGEEPPLPAPLSNYTSNQLFFMTYQRWYCTRGIPNDITGGHTPDDARGPMALKNTPQFSYVFKCPFGSGVSQVKTCSLYG